MHINQTCTHKHKLYTHIYAFWQGGGASASRLSDWLDPSGTGVEKLEGIYADDLIVINGVQINESDSGTQEAELKIELSSKLFELTNDTDFAGWQKPHTIAKKNS